MLYVVSLTVKRFVLVNREILSKDSCAGGPGSSRKLDRKKKKSGIN